MLRQRGVTIALDDFGTGYSSMALLRALPIDVMKVDRAFVAGLGVDDSAMAITRAIVTLARSLRMQIAPGGRGRGDRGAGRDAALARLRRAALGFLTAPVAAPEFERR